MKYVVGIAVDGRVYIEVEANNFNEATEKAIDIFEEMDFGQLENIEAEVINAEDENGKFKNFKGE